MSKDKYHDRDDDSSAEEPWEPWQDEEPTPAVSPASEGYGSEDEDLYEDSSSDSPGNARELQRREQAQGLPAAGRPASPAVEHYEDDEFDEDQLEDDWEDSYEQDRRGNQLSHLAATWPLGLIAVAAMALLLLAAGGYGVMKQRSAMEQEIRDLQAQLALAGNPAEVSAARATLATLQTDNRELRASLATLRDENRQLGDTLAGLEQQLLAQREATARTPEQPQPARAAEAEAAAPTPEKPAAAAAGADTAGWFVNFGSYRERPLAQQWADRLKPGAGNVVVSKVDVNGSTLYRVRVVGLPSEQKAQSVAQALARKHELPSLWVGRQ